MLGCVTIPYNISVTTNLNKQGRLIETLFQSGSQTTPPCNTLQLFTQSTCTPKQTHPTLNTPPLSRTDPHPLTHSGSMFGDTGCGVGEVYVWRQPAFHGLFWGFLTNTKSKSESVMQCNSFPVSKPPLFVFTLTNGMERRGKVEWKKRNLYQVFFPFSRECFTL